MASTVPWGVISTLPNQNKIQYKGGNGLTGELQISKEGNLAIQIHNNQFCAMKNFGEDEVTVHNGTYNNTKKVV